METVKWDVRHWDWELTTGKWERIALGMGFSPNDSWEIGLGNGLGSGVYILFFK